jgi:hypothetical protein
MAGRSGSVRLCVLSDCLGKHEARGYCAKHYQRLKKYGDPLLGRPKAQSLDEAFELYTEEQGDCLVWTGHFDAKGYGRISYQGTEQQAHRVAWERENGPLAEGLLVDHKCHNPPCVRVTHLRPATHKQNNENVRGPRKDSKTGVLGVSWHKASQKYRAQVRHNGVNLDFGGYDSIQEAGDVAKAKRLELFTHNDIDRQVA